MTEKLRSSLAQPPHIERFILNCRGHLLDCRPGLANGAHVMGILNVTPDSFSDGGRFLEPGHALAHAFEMLAEGAAIIDVGGASSRPRGATYGTGAQPLSAREEADRVLPVIEALARERPGAIISIDTYRPDVAREALESGAHMVNDITGLRFDPRLADVAASFDAPLILMHSLGSPGDMPHVHAFDDVVAAVKAGLGRAVAVAVAAGVRFLVTDPGFGFGKTPDENFRLINNVDALVEMGRPVLVGVSRKSAIGIGLAAPDAPAPIESRLFGSLGATAAAVVRGATLVRAHDVRPTVEMLRILGTTLQMTAER